jgi:mannose-1-phosphate guanylyltransferase
MTLSSSNLHSCIVIADDHEPDWAPAVHCDAQPGPVQYSRLGSSPTLLQKALIRASRIARPSQIAVTVLEEERDCWESSLWFVPPANHFVSDNRATSELSRAAALLSIADKWPSGIVTILPARCYVEQEWILSAALQEAIHCLPGVREGIITLGMRDMQEGIDEDYFVVARAHCGPGFTIRGIARRPIPWIARSLQGQGAMVASGIMIGYAGVFAAHISAQWPGLTLKLNRLAAAAAVVADECEVPSSLQRGVPNTILRTLRCHPPSLAQRVFRVSHCGWSTLKSPRAVSRVSAFMADSADDAYSDPNCTAPSARVAAEDL